MLLEICLEKRAAEDALSGALVPLNQRLALVSRLDELEEERLEKLAARRLTNTTLGLGVGITTIFHAFNPDGTVKMPAELIEYVGGMDENIGKRRKDEEGDEEGDPSKPFGPPPPDPYQYHAKNKRRNNSAKYLVK